jgi:hypothetical protein
MGSANEAAGSVAKESHQQAPQGLLRRPHRGVLPLTAGSNTEAEAMQSRLPTVAVISTILQLTIRHYSLFEN